MNKKRLSVVMAGAMLASSVAPVLAAEVQKEQVSLTNKGTLIKELTDAVYDAPRYSDDIRVLDADLRGKSVYTIQVGNAAASTTVRDASAVSRTAVQKAIQTALNGVTAGTVVKLVDLGHKEVTEEDKKVVLSHETTTKYTESELKSTTADSLYGKLNELKVADTASEKFNAVVKDFGYNYDREAFIITLDEDVKNAGTVKADGTGREVVLTTKSNRLDLTNYKYSAKADGTDITEVAWSANTLTGNETKFYGFVEAKAPTSGRIPSSVVKEYTMTSGGTSYELSDLYDGAMLTEKGQNLLSLAKDAFAAAKRENVTNSEKAAIQVIDLNGDGTTDITSGLSNAGDAITTTLKKDSKGKYNVAVKMLNYYRAEGITVEASELDTYTISADNEAALKVVLKWLDGAHANVDELSGTDRYETAVKIAKEVTRLTSLDDVDSTGVFNIVLVNGDSLVDGLSAAPLAAKLAGKNGNAPILLTESNELPRATKLYLNELVDKIENNKINVHIVGGTGVVSKSVEKELKGLNLTVKRYAGEDREGTSMAVAKEVGFDNGAFVVGATGEADAMSISGIAAARCDSGTGAVKATPIIVSGFNGLSEDTLEALNDNAAVTVVGGDSAVSESDFNEIKSVAKKVRRISGSDRKATNAAVINAFYKDTLGDAAKSVIVSKDDVLIDALTASNLSAVQNAPIILATNSLSPEQLNAVVENANTAKDLYQVGGGVARDVIRTVAQSLGLVH